MRDASVRADASRGDGGSMPRRSYLAVLGAAVACSAALGAVLRILPGLASDRAALGLLVGAPALTAVVTRPGGGRLADRVGPAPVMLGGAVAMAVGVVPALASAQFGALLASRLLVGAAEGAMMAAAVAWLLRLAGPDRRGLALGHIGLANYAGLTVGPLLATALGREVVPVLAAATLLPLAGAALASTARRPAPVARSAEPGAGVARAVLGPGAALMLVNVGYVALLAFGEPASGCGLVVPLFAAGVIVVRTVGGAVPDRVGARRTAMAACTVAAAGLLALALARSPLPALGATALLALGQALAVPALGLLVLTRVPAARAGAAAGMFFAFFDAGVGAGGPLTGLAARATSPSGALGTAAAAVAGAALIASFRPPER